MVYGGFNSLLLLWYSLMLLSCSTMLLCSGGCFLQSYGMIAWKAHQMGMDDFGLDYGNPDFAKYAESYGAIGHNVTSADEFVTIFRKCIAEPGVHVIDLPISYETSDQALHVELPQEVEKLQETVGKMIAEYDAGLAAMEADFTNER